MFTIWTQNVLLKAYDEAISTNISNETWKYLGGVFSKDVMKLFGFAQCEYTKVWVQQDKLKTGYITYGDYKKDLPSQIRDDIPWQDQCLKVWFVDEQQVSVTLKGKKKMTVARSYAKEQVDEGIWFVNPASGIYSDTLPDYDAFTAKYKGAPRPWPKPNQKTAYGHEFELKFPSYDAKIEFANEIKKNHGLHKSIKNGCICEHDGSLDGQGVHTGPSLELITPPWGFQESLQQLSQITEVIKRHGGRGHIKDNGGLGYAWHITVNLMDAENPVLAGSKLMCLINDVALQPFWTKMARRTTSYNPANGKYYAQFEQDINLENALSPEIWGPRWKNNDHYYAAFYRKNQESIELRIFRSTATHSTIQATLEVVDLAWKFCKSDTPVNPFNWYVYLTEHASTDTMAKMEKFGAYALLAAAAQNHAASKNYCEEEEV